jgi:formimidoylglutamate deiminase
MRSYRFEAALLPEGWARDICIAVSDSGMIAGVGGPADSPDAQRIDGIAVPGMPNAHSHAFQRAMIGDAEFRQSAQDSFWTWRNAMYALANRVCASDLQIIATRLFIEMLKSGYTCVAEFHYLHRGIDGGALGDDNPLHRAIAEAARVAGIGLTLLPTLYQHSDFGAKPLREDQRRFAMSLAEFVAAIDFRSRAAAPGSLIRCGSAFHSLRAVGIPVMREAIAELKKIDANMPVHIHVAEQLREVNACRRTTGKRPIELLLDEGLLSQHWCLVHATHANAAELNGVAAAGAAICVCPTTEGNLGDGFFNAEPYLALGGRLCIGSDSQASVCAAEELRWFEYQHRLKRKRRAVLASPEEPHVGTRLWREAARSGARALGQPVGEIREGLRADWLVLDPHDPAMAGARIENVLDRLVFTNARSAIRDVVVGGRWVVGNRVHALDDANAIEFEAWMRA